MGNEFEAKVSDKQGTETRRAKVRRALAITALSLPVIGAALGFAGGIAVEHHNNGNDRKSAEKDRKCIEIVHKFTDSDEKPAEVKLASLSKTETETCQIEDPAVSANSYKSLVNSYPVNGIKILDAKIDAIVRLPTIATLEANAAHYDKAAADFNRFTVLEATGLGAAMGLVGFIGVGVVMSEYYGHHPIRFSDAVQTAAA